MSSGAKGWRACGRSAELHPRWRDRATARLRELQHASDPRLRSSKRNTNRGARIEKVFPGVNVIVRFLGTDGIMHGTPDTNAAPVL